MKNTFAKKLVKSMENYGEMLCRLAANRKTFLT